MPSKPRVAGSIPAGRARSQPGRNRSCDPRGAPRVARSSTRRGGGAPRNSQKVRFQPGAPDPAFGGNLKLKTLNLELRCRQESKQRPEEQTDGRPLVDKARGWGPAQLTKSSIPAGRARSRLRRELKTQDFELRTSLPAGIEAATRGADRWSPARGQGPGVGPRATKAPIA